MANPLYNMMANNNNNPEILNFIQQVKEYKKTFRGNPQEEVEKLLNSGRMSQQQFNQLSQIAQQIVQMMGE